MFIAPSTTWTDQIYTTDIAQRVLNHLKWYKANVRSSRMHKELTRTKSTAALRTSTFPNPVFVSAKHWKFTRKTEHLEQQSYTKVAMVLSSNWTWHMILNIWKWILYCSVLYWSIYIAHLTAWAFQKHSQLQHWYCVRVNKVCEWRTCPRSPTRQLQLDSNLQPSGRKALNSPLSHHAQKS